MALLVVAILVVLVGSGLCSGAETALLSVPEVRVRQMAEDRSRRARALLAIKQHMARPISAIVVLNNIFNIVGSITVGVIATREFGEAWVGVVSAVLTFLVILFAELMPKTLAERHAERVAIAVAIPVFAITKLLTPLVLLFETLMKPLTRGQRAPLTNESEIRLLAHIGGSEGIIEADEVEMIQRVFQLNDRTAKDLMTPRTAVTWLEADRPVAEARDEIVASPHSRIIVAENNDLDDCIGVALKDDLLAAMLDGGTDTVRDHTRDVVGVPWMTRADDLLRQFRSQREHLVLVVDEFGGTMGVVALEDVIEIITGPILDETDQRADLQGYARAKAKARLRSRQPAQRPSVRPPGGS